MAEVFDFGLQQHKIKMDGKFFENNLFAVAGDTGRRLEVQLLDSNNLVQNTTGISLRLNADVAGQATYAEATLVDAARGLYELDLPNGMLIAPGNWQFQWQIIGANGDKLHSFAFMGSIGSNLAEGGTEATNFYLNADELKQMQDDLINGTFDSEILETNIAEKLNNLEEQYAPKLTEVTAQLAQKVGGGKLATMADIGQDIKTSITGGSVAVVGPNSTGNVNLINKQITPDKLTDVIDISRNDIPVYLSGAYMSSTGAVTSVDWNIRVFEIDKSVKSIDLIGTTVTDSSAFFKYPDDTMTPILSRYFTNSITQHATLFINERISQPTTQVQSVRLIYSNYGETELNRFNLDGKETLYGNGYIQNGIVKTLVTYSMYKIKIDQSYNYYGEFVGTVYGSLFNANDEYLREITKSTTNIINVGDASYMIVNVNPQTKIYAMRKSSSEENPNTAAKLITSAVNKPLVFQSKKIALFADSIGQGNNGSGVYANTWFSKMCTKFEGVGTNYSISGSMYTGTTVGSNGIQSITNKIKTTDLSTFDIIILAGGTNDATYNVNYTTFRNSLSSLFAYIKLNSSAQIVVISPINRTRAFESGLKNMNDYRNIIAEETLLNNFNYINGNELPFVDYAGTYQEQTMPDGLHPNQLGHDIYLSGVLSSVI